MANLKKAIVTLVAGATIASPGHSALIHGSADVYWTDVYMQPIFSQRIAQLEFSFDDAVTSVTKGTMVGGWYESPKDRWEYSAIGFETGSDPYAGRTFTFGDYINGLYGLTGGTSDFVLTLSPTNPMGRLGNTMWLSGSGSPSGGGNNVFADLSFRSVGTNAVPEPLTWTMMITGFGLIGAELRRKSRLGQRRASENLS